jgi:hypothetical protein
MNDLFDVVLASSLYEKENIRKNVLCDFFPSTLLKKIGYDELVGRIPDSILKAQFAKFLAAQYYYENGVDSSVYQFYEFVSKYDK